MPGVAKNYDAAHIHQGPGDLWIIVAGVPSDSAQRLTLATDGTPDATAHAGSIHLGLFDSAITLGLAPKFEDIKSDQFSGPIDRYVTEEEAHLEVELQQLDPNLIQNANALGVYSTGTGYAQLTFGGLATLASVCVAAIAPKRAVAGKFVVSLFYKSHGVMGLQTTIGRAKKSIYKAQFKALTDPTRTAGRQQGVVYETT